MHTGRKKTGGKYQINRKKKLYEKRGQARKTKLGEEKRKSKKVMGGGRKVFLLKVKSMNLRDGKKIIKSEIKNVLETPSNRFFARQNILTKGTIVETSHGKAKITNRPTQEGVVNGILLK
ncbi:MAG: 30S ribosomal protein S8e [Candidatus Pacearchaeota archaeon]|nr:30S ribosomal protein S8e [Candidatus Pacearchaeota archaeon]MDE1848463.1 30S ribosomal protein S8e [Nanoarchaeota archaeon]